METNNFFKKEFPALLLLLIPFVMIGIYWNDFPPQIPTHWNFSNEVDQYTRKEIGLFLVPGLNIILYFMFFLLPRIDPKRENYKVFGTSYNVLRLSIIGMLFFLFVILFLAGLGNDLNIGVIVINLTLVLFMVLGNYMGKFKSNYFVGIKTPWTLANEDNWNRTHRMAGKLWVFASIAMMIVGMLLPLGILAIVYFIYIGLIVLIPVVYSYVIHIKEGKNV